ncbi:hypothetical protein TCAL_07148 [Tigriopus californicus]|uniref:Small-subunit processome Utp12 domain-containing protein n=1 Tax=Tigriopus californicus TaxID=6832 RepID=A0A553NC87_TIGCA|nr:WD repeat-containing protein 43-like [Tigriopus californicus]TRY63064.1 hypothetical protein TCAL_07148 [Tigriopus californicus]|eukprot:TCALIF_07148-PA protein Name:"Similar to Wdr43 WD repeat-containing protein 43 (Mus musculus)" AED:0.02 eAED:0.02 QI:258/1/1/1/1/1/8/195/673
MPAAAMLETGTRGSTATSSAWSAEPYRFTGDERASHLGLITPDGRLKVFNRSLNALKAEFLPTSHLTAACTALAWRPETLENPKSPKKNRKRKSSLSSMSNGVDGSEGGARAKFDQMAIGTADGSIVIYSLQSGQVKHNEAKVHASRVNDLVWNTAGSIVYSCDEAGYIGQFPISKAVFTKFKCGIKKASLFSIRLHPQGSSLIVGSKSQMIWIDLESQKPIHTFVDHQGDIRALSVFTSSESAYVCASGSSEKDLTVSVWKLDANILSQDNPEVTLNVNETVHAICTSPSHHDDVGNGVRIGCVTASGMFHCFEFDPESKRKKGKLLKPKLTIQVATGKDKSTGSKVVPLPVLGAALAENKVFLVHGSHSRPAFEECDYDQLEKVTCLIRTLNTAPAQIPTGTKVTVPDSASSKDIVVVGPGASMAKATLRKRKTSVSDKLEDLPMIDRLRLLSKETDHVTTPPRTDSVLQLLLQGLHNQDRRILDSVLDRADLDMIDKTVQKLPVEGVIPLIQELHHYIQGRGMVNSSHSKWLKSVLQHHTSFLMSNAHCQELLGPVYAMLEARTRHYASLAQLKGKLDILTKQITMKPEERKSMDVAKEALLSYKDDSSDDQSDIMDELLPPPSDIEDNWKINNDEEEEDEDSDEDDEEQVNGDEEDEVEDDDEEDMDSD